MTVAVPDWAVNRSLPQPVGYVAEAFERLLVAAEGQDAERPDLIETPARAAKAWAERTAGYRMDAGEHFKTFDGAGYDEMVVVKDIPLYSTCEHHLEDITGVAHVAYIADGKIVGLSKLARVVDVYALRLQTQERLGMQVAAAIESNLAPKGVAVVIEARHMCMERRGVRKPGCTTVTSVLRGAMKDDPRARAEVLSLMGVR